MTRGRRFAALGACALLAACAGAPPQAPSALAPPPAAAGPSPVQAFAQRWRERAEAAAREGRLADAADAWEILAVLDPSDAEAAERLAGVRREIAAGVDDHLARARQAGKRGELEAATTQYLAVLALQPGHAQAADGLRAIERERNRRALAKAASARKSSADAPGP